VNENFILLKEPHCKGFDYNNSQTVGEWMASQGLALYNQMNDMLMEIISLKNLYLPGPLDRESREIFHMALYDLDIFRSKIINEGLLDNRHLDPGTLDTIRNDDVALLKFGHGWVIQKLFSNNGVKHSRFEVKTSD
jgi:hypothetical protein